VNYRAFTPVLLTFATLALSPVAQAARPEKAVTATPNRALYLQLIRQARADGRPRAAIAYLDDFALQFPGDREALLLRVNSLLDLGQIDNAESALATLPRSTTPKDTAAADAMHGHVAAARGQWDAAIPLYTRAVAGDPTSPILRNALGYALLRAHRTDAAIEALRGAADLAPADDVIRNNLLLAYTVSGQKSALTNDLDRNLRRQITTEATRISDSRVHSAALQPKDSLK
jgi:Flp pilus assembly protein TadD